MTAAFSDPVCPCCRRTVLHAVTVRTWRGQDVCLWCADDLESNDAIDARRAIESLLAETRLRT